MNRRWYCEGEFVLLVVLVFAFYMVRIGDLSLRGEESRWAQVAREMLWSGNWVVPCQQGEPFLSRPPLQSWLIAGATLVRGSMDAVAVRLPAVTATLLITHQRRASSRAAALAGSSADCGPWQPASRGTASASAVHSRTGDTDDFPCPAKPPR